MLFIPSPCERSVGGGKKTVEHQNLHDGFANHHWNWFHFNWHLVLD
jgi:hypothetical protein